MSTPEPASPTPAFLPYGRQTIDGDDVAAVSAALRGDLITGGPFVAAFESALQDATGAAHAIACSSGTAALHMAVAGLGLGPGSVCVAPAVTFLSTANAPAFVGARVAFADVDPETGLMTADTLARALHGLGGRADAILAVHLGGLIADLEGLSDQAARAGAVLLEDACHAIGGEGPTGRVGGCARSAAATFSFHPVKTVCAGEGGAVTTPDGALAERMRRFRNHAVRRDPEAFSMPEEAFEAGAPNPWWYEMDALGHNYRMSDVHAALGMSQLVKLPRFAARRRRLTALYRDALAPLRETVMAPPAQPDVTPCPHLFTVRIDFAALGVSRRRVMERLKARGVGSQVHYIPVPWQPWWRDRVGPLALPGAEAWYRRALSLPLFPAMNDHDPKRVVDALQESLHP